MRPADPAALHGLTDAQARTLARLVAGENISGGNAGVALLRKGLVAKSDQQARGAWGGYIVTDAGTDMMRKLRRDGW